jgi:hypothetical protein
MPPVAKAGGDAFRKDVSFTAKDDVEQRAVGIVMVPDKADLQHDFAREDTIREFASQFENFVEAGEGDGGIMHAAWPSDWMALDRNEVLDESETINGTTAPAGAWIQEWEFNDDELWSLIEDGILEGYSIGAINVDWNGPFVPDEDEAVDDVEVPDQLGEDAMVWELVDGLIREVSAVDIPAVPDAEILDTKADAQKRLADHLGDRDGFIEEMLERGHSEADAERAWDVLNRAIEVEGATEPGKESALAKAGRAFLSALAPGSSDAKAETAETPDTDPRGRAKEGRTLSKPNRESVMASIDAGLDILEDAGMDHGMTRFTDRDDVDFDLSEHDARAWGASEDPEDEDGDASPINNAADGETSADDGSTTAADDMSNDDGTNDGGSAKSLAERNAEQINELTDAVKNLTEAVNDDGGDDSGAGEKTADVELPSGEVVEVSKSEAMSWFDDDGESETKAADEEVTKADIEALHDRLDSIAREGAGSQQLDGGSDDGSDGGLDALGKNLS